MDFYGIYTPVITPHFDDYSIDEAGFADVIESLIADGVHGIIIAGTTGEYYAQSLEERQRMLARMLFWWQHPLIQCQQGAKMRFMRWRLNGRLICL